MSTSATRAQEAHQLAAAEASHKRKRGEATDHADEKVVERKYGLDRDILDCPICMEPFAPPVYQCQNGHTTCWDCCKKLINRRCPSCTLLTGSIRCIAIEKLVESLSVSCKYACHGCEQMQRPSGIENHEADCEYEPFRCPVPECEYEASRDPLLWHLTERHHISTVAHNNDTGVSFKMAPSDRIVMVNADLGETNLIYLVHRVHILSNIPGDIFFCTYFGGFDVEEYNLRVKHRGDSVPHFMESAPAINLRCMKEYLRKDFLLVPAKDFGEFQSVAVNFKVTDRYDHDDDL